MFTNSSSEAVGFESSLNQTKTTSSSSVQTVEIKTSDKETSSLCSACAQTQTDPTGLKKPAEVDYSQLASWLKRIYPKVAAELSETEESHAFDNYDAQCDNSVENYKLLQVFKFSPDKTIDFSKLSVSGLAWNCTGNTLAVACRQEHESWCNHLPPVTNVHFFTVDRNGKYPEVPNKVQMSKTCITSISFHPVLPDVLAGGNCSGEVIIWSSHPTLTKLSHNDSITQVTWLNKKSNEDEYILATSGLDSHLFLWKYSFNSDSLIISQRFKLDPASLNYEKYLLTGILCFAFSPCNPDKFIVSIEGGLVLQCLLHNKTTPIEIVDDITTYNPAVLEYESYDGKVNNIIFAPDGQETFFTCGSDGVIYKYRTESIAPNQRMYSEELVNKLYRVPNEPRVVLGCGQKGQLKFFSLLNGRLMEGPPAHENNPLTVAALNPKNCHQVAVGDVEGNVQIWNIMWNQVINANHKDIK